MTSTRLIQILVPSELELPKIMSELTLEENVFILTSGCRMIQEARNVVANVSQKEIYNRVKEETRQEIQKLEMDLLVQKSLNETSGNYIKEMYETRLNEMQKTINGLNKELQEYKNASKLLVHQEVEKEREKSKAIIEDKTKQVLRITENYEKILQQQAVTKSSKKLGDEGEDNFMLLSETFKDFQGYKIEKKSHQAHKGDFHLFFDKFNVLVDLKNYSGIVQKKELEKIEHDLSVNNTMDFAWLISYESNVSDWNRFPIMFKWIVTDNGLKCIVIVNKLNTHKNPVDTMRNLWSITNELYTIMSLGKENNEDSDELRMLKERDYTALQKIKTLYKRSGELKRNIMSMSQIVKDIENDILDSISLFTNEVSKSEINKESKIKEWWNENMEHDETIVTECLSSTDVWLRFKKDNKEYVDENKLTTEQFRNYIKSFLEIEEYVEKSKKGAIEIKYYRFRDLLVTQDSKNEKKENKMDVELTIPNNVEKKKKVIKKRKVKIVVSEELDKEVVEMYNHSDTNIMEISDEKNIQVWQVVSILIVAGVIGKRSEARGYEMYKETDEYKSKIKKHSVSDDECSELI